jgi:hypothetical protein
MTSRSRFLSAASRATLAALSITAAGAAFAVQPGTYTGYSEGGFPVTVQVVALHGGRTAVTMYDYTQIVDCPLSHVSYIFGQTLISGALIAADGSFTMGTTSWTDRTQMTGRFDDAGHLVGVAFQQDPMLTLEDPQRAEFCTGPRQHLAARLTAAAAAPAAPVASDFHVTTHVDANGHVVSREVVRRAGIPAPERTPLASAGATAMATPGHYTGTNSQGHPVSFDVQLAADGVSPQIVHYQSAEDMVCELTGQPAYSSGFVVKPQAIAADGSFAFTSADLFAHYDVTGMAQPDGSFTGTTREMVSGLSNLKPQSAERCLAAGPLTWTATLQATAAR